MAQTLPFFGREQELAWLRSRFESAATRGADGKFAGPKLAVILAESGHGKSRLVQELYLRLTTDERWDPPEASYWPDAFRDLGAQLRVNPDMQGHQPSGPPRFMWLGVRWQPTDQRNVDSRSALPDLRSELGVHMAIIDRHRDLMTTAVQRATHAVKKEGVGEIVGQVADALLPFGGLALKLMGGAKRALSDRLAASRSHEQVADEHVQDITDDLFECFDALMHGRHAVPAVLWLDDAQWIDMQTQRFLRRLWTQAKRRRWPLLIVATHWEREWRELVRKDEGSRASTLVSLTEADGQAVLHLPPGGDNDLRAYLLSRLPGLTQAQQDLLLAKAAGNFLAMTENIGDLSNEAMNFVGEDIGGALSPEGEEFVATWETERSKRVEQRFKALQRNVKDMLGWSSRLGVRFLHGVVTDYATRVAMQPDGAEALDWCVDPGVILGVPGKLTREFRDRAFHAVATKYFNTYGKKHAEGLTAVLLERLVEWIAASFDGEGGLIDPQKVPDLPPDSAAALVATGQRVELSHVLDIALLELEAPDGGDWDDPLAVTWLRTVWLAVKNDAEANLWDNVRNLGRRLSEIRWNDVPLGVLGKHERRGLATRLETAGVLDAATPVLVDLLAKAREHASAEPGPDAFKWLSACLSDLGSVAETIGDLEAAQARFVEALAIDRALCAETGTPESRRDVSYTLSCVANLAETNGCLDTALANYAEALEIDRALCAELGTPECRRDVSFCLLCIGALAATNGDLETAQANYAEAMEIRRALCAELGTPRSRQDLSACMERLADLCNICGDLKTAQAHLTESLEATRALCAELGTPGCRQDLLGVLGRLGDLAVSNGDLVAAQAYYAETLEIGRALCAELGTPRSRRDVSVSLERLGSLAKTNGDLSTAQAYYAEVLAIKRALCAELGTPDSRRGLSVLLGLLGDLARLSCHMETAQAHHSESLAIRRALWNELGTPQSRQDLAAILERLGHIAEICGDLQTAQSHYLEALAIHRALSAELGTPDSRGDVACSLCHVADLAQTNGELETARALLTEALAIERDLSAELGTPGRRQHVAFTLDRLAGLAETDGDLETAQALYAEGLELYRSVCAELGTPESRRDVSVSLFKLGGHAERKGDLETALSNCAEALEISRALCVSLDTPMGRQDLVAIMQRLGKLSATAGDLETAQGYFAQAVEISRAVCAEVRTTSSRQVISTLLGNVGDLARMRGDLEAAQTHHAEALAIRRALHMELGTPSSRRHVIHGLNRLGDISNMLGQTAAAAAYAAEADALGQSIDGEAIAP